MRWAALAPLAIWAYLLGGRGAFWRTDVRLPAVPEPCRWPPVAVVVPARDEAAILTATLPALLAQDYPGPARVVVVDDRSGDGTAGVARSLAGGGRLPLTVVAGTDPPAGWAGKLWAVEQGIAAALGPGAGSGVRVPPPATGAGAASGGPGPPPPTSAPAPPFPAPTYLLLTDADIAHPPDSLRRLVAWAEAAGADQVSLMARLRTAGGWERLLVPAFVYFFAQLYPFRWVNRPGTRSAAAAGGCLLVRAAALARAGGIGALRAAVIDDVALARALKRTGGRLWLGLADEVASVRPYPRLGDMWNMVARSAFNQLRYSKLALAATVVGLAVTFWGPPAALGWGAAAGDPLVAGAGAAALVAMAASYLPMVRYYRLGWWRCLTLPAAAGLYAAMTVSSAVRHWRGGLSWKGRRL